MVSGILSDCMVFEVANTNCVDDRCACKQDTLNLLRRLAVVSGILGFFMVRICLLCIVAF